MSDVERELDSHDGRMTRIEAKVDKLLEQKSALDIIKWVLGGAWGAILFLFHSHFVHK